MYIDGVDCNACLSSLTFMEFFKSYTTAQTESLGCNILIEDGDTCQLRFIFINLLVGFEATFPSNMFWNSFINDLCCLTSNMIF